MPSCLFCRDSDQDTVFTEFGIPYLRCRSCGHLFSSHESVEHYDGYFEEVGDELRAELYWNLAHESMYRAFAARYMSERSGRLLDVGGGLGFFVKFASRVPGWEACGVEISPGGWKFGKERLGLKNYFCGKLEDQPFGNGSFDMITLWDVIEHIKDPRPLLGKCLDLLGSGGVLFMHTPNGGLQLVKAKVKKRLFGEKEGMHFLEARDHLHLYGERSLRRLLSECGFDRARFVHLPPIQAVAGERTLPRLALKNGWWACAVALSSLTLGRVNADNLFAEARKA